ncbi:MAG: MgtC/SapB family protein [Phycisphaerae bacterium]|nr:MgtC/SapB family protein [Phycisphaerae bacterium]MDW8262443.1 MgtC/SapB family protein [Phycisphaerales bacterium]
MLQNLDHVVTEWVLSLGWPLDGLLRILAAAVAGGLVGLERELRGRQAGFRTYLLVCMGSAIVMVVSTRFASFPFNPPALTSINVDPARIAYGVMTGIGFLGAGVIVHGKGSVRGLTTAAGIWCIAGVGLALGFGLVVFGMLSAILIVFALWVLDYVEEALPKVRYRTVTIRTLWRPNCISDCVRRFKQAGFKIIDVRFDRNENLTSVDVHMHICFLNIEQYINFEREMEGDTVYQLMATREL